MRSLRLFFAWNSLREHDRPPFTSIPFSLSLSLSLFRFSESAEKQILFRVTEPAGRLTPSFGFSAQGVHLDLVPRSEWPLFFSFFYSYSFDLVPRSPNWVVVRSVNIPRSKFIKTLVHQFETISESFTFRCSTFNVAASNCVLSKRRFGSRRFPALDDIVDAAIDSGALWEFESRHLSRRLSTSPMSHWSLAMLLRIHSRVNRPTSGWLFVLVVRCPTGASREKRIVLQRPSRRGSPVDGSPSTIRDYRALSSAVAHLATARKTSRDIGLGGSQ